MRARPRSILPGVLGIVAVIGLAGGTVFSQVFAPPINDRPNPYETIRNWAPLPDGRPWGSTAGIDMDPDGKTVWAIDRCGANSCAGSKVGPILKIDPSGKLLASFGGGMFIFPHGIHVDREGNVWVTDGRTASQEELAKFPDAKGKGHTVVKFSPTGKVLLTIGHAGMAGSSPMLTEPNDVVTGPNGDVYIGEGHGGQGANATPDTVARVSKWDRTGKFIRAWGKLGSAPGEFRTPHALVFDAKGRLFVADRGNHRIQIFDQDGKYLSEFTEFSRVSGMFIRDGMMYAIDSESNSNNHKGWRKGARIGSVNDGKVQFFIPGHVTDSPDGAAGEGIAVAATGEIYAAENTVRGLTKYVKRAGTK
jgi:sugar lactone lactonase YvrE